MAWSTLPLFLHEFTRKLNVWFEGPGRSMSIADSVSGSSALLLCHTKIVEVVKRLKSDV